MTGSTNDADKMAALEAIKAQRAALKNFYKLKEDTEAEESSAPKNTPSYSLGEAEPACIEDLDEYIATEPYLNLLKTENKVLEKLSSSKSEIKSIIYNNYYELIKINNVLEDLIKPNDGKVYFETITENLHAIRNNIEQIKTSDIDIFDDLSTADSKR